MPSYSQELVTATEAGRTPLERVSRYPVVVRPALHGERELVEVAEPDDQERQLWKGQGLKPASRLGRSCGPEFVGNVDERRLWPGIHIAGAVLAEEGERSQAFATGPSHELTAHEPGPGFGNSAPGCGTKRVGQPDGPSPNGRMERYVPRRLAGLGQSQKIKQESSAVPGRGEGSEGAGKGCPTLLLLDEGAPEGEGTALSASDNGIDRVVGGCWVAVWNFRFYP